MLRRHLLTLLVLLCALLLFFFNQEEKGPKNFSQAKLTATAVHQQAVTFYCGCPIRWQDNKGQPDLAVCGYRPRKNVQRAQRIEWEHVVPAWQFGHQRPCWQVGGRAACEQDAQFNKIEADLHNLQPVIGEINGDRKHFSFDEWPGKRNQYGRCTMKIDFKNKRVDPPRRARGAIARTYLYMRDRYQLEYVNQSIALLERWHKTYPVTDWECQRDQAIAKRQGHHNPYVLEACQQRKTVLADPTKKVKHTHH